MTFGLGFFWLFRGWFGFLILLILGIVSHPILIDNTKCYYQKYNFGNGLVAWRVLRIRIALLGLKQTWDQRIIVRWGPRVLLQRPSLILKSADIIKGVKSGKRNLAEVIIAYLLGIMLSPFYMTMGFMSNKKLEGTLYVNLSQLRQPPSLVPSSQGSIFKFGKNVC